LVENRNRIRKRKHCGQAEENYKPGKKSILLIGPPNVGKSVFFNYFTGLEASVGNYAGTTVEFSRGRMKLEGDNFELIDVPGTYTLDATNPAEKVAVEMIKQKPAGIICVLDANSLENGLYLLFQVLEFKIPTVVAINRTDLARERGYFIDVKTLENELQIPVVETIALDSHGLDIVRENILTTGVPDLTLPENSEKRWEKAEILVKKAQKNQGELGESFRQKVDRFLTSPWPGLPLAFIILALIFAIIIGIGMGLRQFILLPFFRELVFPPIITLVQGLIPPGTIQNILIGEYGFLIKGLEWPLALVFPYVLSFYLALSILEDSGYLPRFGILLDGLMAKIGLRGSNIIPLLLGYGCAIPGILGTRALESKKERLMISTMISLAVPCISQTGAFFALLAEVSVFVVLALFGFSVLAMFFAGFIMDKILPGKRMETLLEIPELLFPKPHMLGKKVLMRIKGYIFNGAIPMVMAVGVASLLFESGVLVFLGRVFSPLIEQWLRLPQEAAVPLVLGIVRRELAVLPLVDMGLTPVQLLVGAVVALFYVPCIAVLATLAREFSLKISLVVLFITIATAFLIGGIMTRVLELII